MPDSIQAAARSGELRHALEARVFSEDMVYGKMGALTSGRLPERTDEDELTVADLTGLGIQDAAIAALVTRLAKQQDAGRHVPLGES